MVSYGKRGKGKIKRDIYKWGKENICFDGFAFLQYMKLYGPFTDIQYRGRICMSYLKILKIIKITNNTALNVNIIQIIDCRYLTYWVSDL